MKVGIRYGQWIQNKKYPKGVPRYRKLKHSVKYILFNG
jgi:hypothetical protein